METVRKIIGVLQNSSGIKTNKYHFELQRLT